MCDSLHLIQFTVFQIIHNVLLENAVPELLCCSSEKFQVVHFYANAESNGSIISVKFDLSITGLQFVKIVTPIFF